MYLHALMRWVHVMSVCLSVFSSCTTSWYLYNEGRGQ